MGSLPIPGSYSASRACAVTGLHPYMTRFHIFQILKEEMEPGWNAKHGYALPEFPDNAPIRWGHAFEDAVIKLAEEREGVDITQREELFTKSFVKKETSVRATTDPGPGVVTLSCHIDGAFLPSCPTTLHEGKTTNTRAFYSSKEEIEEALYEETGQILKDFKLVKRWGEPGTDQVPLEYQVQTAVQRICTGAELVKLSVLVFEKVVDEYEKLGWVFNNLNELVNIAEDYKVDDIIYPYEWAKTLAQMGNFHQYLLPSNPALETAIIKAVQEFHEKHVLTGLPPRAENYDDIKRLCSNPQGTIVTSDDEFKEKCREYSELTRQLGDNSPLEKRRIQLKVEIMNTVNETEKKDWVNPPDKVIILDSKGGDQLASFGKNKNGVLTFRAKRA